MSKYQLKKGESLADGYLLIRHTDPDYEDLLIDVDAPDGNLAVLSFEEGDKDIVVHWPVGSEWFAARTGSFTDIMRALEFGERHLLRSQIEPERRVSTFELGDGESLPDGYDAQVRSDADKGRSIELRASDGVVATLSIEAGDKDVVVHWPVGPEWTRSPTGSFTDVMRALEFGKNHLLRLQKEPESEV